VDVFDEANSVRVIAEMPGVTEDEIAVKLEGKKIILDASREGRRYHKVIELPCEVKDVKKRYHQGILEVEMVKNGT